MALEKYIVDIIIMLTCIMPNIASRELVSNANAQYLISKTKITVDESRLSAINRPEERQITGRVE